MVLIKLTERCCVPRGGKGACMWTLARMPGSQAWVFFSLGDLFFFFSVLFSISVACIRERLAEMCREQRRESASLVLFSSAARLTVCGRANECVHNEPGWHVHFTALLPH